MQDYHCLIVHSNSHKRSKNQSRLWGHSPSVVSGDAFKKFLDDWSDRERDQFVGLRRYERYEPGGDERADYRNGYYERDWVTVFGTVRLRVARTRGKAFLPKCLRRFQKEG